MKQVLLILFTLIFSVTFAQKNEYFGSAIIKKNEYFVKIKDSNLYWSDNKNNAKVYVTKNNDKRYQKIMFIPAGNGFYFIKFVKTGNYLTAGNLQKTSFLSSTKPIKNNTQKFKVVRVANSKFKFITSNMLAVEFIAKHSNSASNVSANSLGGQAENGKLRIWDNNASKNQKYEIIEADTKKKLQ